MADATFRGEVGGVAAHTQCQDGAWTTSLSVDGSESARAALRWAVDEGSLHGATVVALLAWNYLDQPDRAGDNDFDPGYGAEEAQAELRAAVEVVAPDVAVDQQVVCDLPARALLEAGAGADLLVVGARGLGGFKGLLLGSVSERVIEEAKCRSSWCAKSMLAPPTSRWSSASTAPRRRREPCAGLLEKHRAAAPRCASCTPGSSRPWPSRVTADWVTWPSRGRRRCSTRRSPTLRSPANGLSPSSPMAAPPMRCWSTLVTRRSWSWALAGGASSVASSSGRRAGSWRTMRRARPWSFHTEPQGALNLYRVAQGLPSLSPELPTRKRSSMSTGFPSTPPREGMA